MDKYICEYCHEHHATLWDYEGNPVCSVCAEEMIHCDFCGNLCESHECPLCKEERDFEHGSLGLDYYG